MTHLQDYLDDLEKHLAGLPADERQAVLDEVRDHLEQDIDRRVSDGAAYGAASRAATEAFGSPKDIAAGYDSEAKLLLVDGEVVLAVGRTLGKGARMAGRGALVVGRGAGKVLKWGLISALVLITVAGAITIAGLALFDDEIKEAVPRPIDSYDRNCTTTNPCAGPDRAASFDIGPDIKEFRVHIDGDCDAGSARVTATDPSGDVLILSENACESGGLKTFSEQGRWSIDVVYTGYIGSVDIQVWAFERA